MIDNITFTSNDNSSLFEDYMLQYDLFLAESNTFRTLTKIDNCSLQESYINEQEILNESIKETLTLWITRFTEAIQRTVNRFMNAIEGAKDAAYLKSIETRVNELNTDPGFSVNNIRNYKDDIIRNFKVVDFQQVYNTNKDSLQNAEKFLVTNYSDFGFSAGNTDIKKVMEEHIVEVLENAPISVDNIKAFYAWCKNDYINDINPINQQLNQYNTSVKSISNLINSLPDDFRNPVASTNGESNVNASYIFTGNYSVFSEADGTDNSQQTITNTSSATNDSEKAGKMTFDDKVDKVAKVGGENQEVVTAVKTYLTCTTNLLSSVFQIVKNRKADYMRILKHLFPAGKDIRNQDINNNQVKFNDYVPKVNVPGVNN